MAIVKDTAGSAVGGFYLGVAIVIAVATYGFVRATFPSLAQTGMGNGNGNGDGF